MHALADDLAWARELPEPPVGMTGTSLTFDSREAVLAAAEALPQDITPSLEHHGSVTGGIDIGPAVMFDGTPTPTRHGRQGQGSSDVPVDGGRPRHRRQGAAKQAHGRGHRHVGCDGELAVELILAKRSQCRGVQRRNRLQ